MAEIFFVCGYVIANKNIRKDRERKMKENGFLKRILTKQWSFFWAGVVFGIAQIIYMIGGWVANLQAGKKPTLSPITVTTDLGRMFRSLELSITKFLHLPDFQLYGHSVDGVANGGAFVPGVGWPIVGMVIGGALVALAEREFRIWVKYPPKMLLVTFIGGAFFSYGTRLAGGCTLNHLIGGIPLLSIHSTITVIFMAIGGFLGFAIMSKLGLAKYFKHQETLSYVKGNDFGESITYDPNYNPRKKKIWWIALMFVTLFFVLAAYSGFANPESLQHLKDGKLVSYGKSVADKGWFYVISTLIAGIIAGFGMAKSGYGTECSLVSIETGASMCKNDSKYAKLGIPRITRTLMRGYLPIIGMSATWVVMLALVVPVWLFLGVSPGFESGIKYQLTLGNIFGGLFLGMGAVLLIGCEIRSYMRVGLGYLNTWIGIAGFAVGYLPFTLFYKQHTAFFEATRITETYKWYQLFFPDNILAQKIFLTIWWFVLGAFLLYLLRKGAQQTGVTKNDILKYSTEDLQLLIDKTAKDGMINGVSVPKPADGK